ncbi:hypothetical protein O7632_28225 [Solwaraspora sp. WMMD406]|uniref:DUF6767 domain-containing protein n=1 Tax=Solwaraspora sp. WMMD406 TaxID=3016095 RepID=UPI002416338E|nr:DUF6767 domain-containing protein [Solwaraspora sp. WMMD406]MDG4767951.1 hypothetical protein [Solwaraspora sp. WMMD406]
MTSRTHRRVPEAKCPIRPGEPCTLCLPGATGPADCGLVYLVMGDDELREGLRQARLEAAGETVPA